MRSITSITETEQNVHHIKFDDGRILILVGTAHVSQNSVALVERIINDEKPGTVAVELDEKRFKAMMDKGDYENLDIVEIIKKKKLLFVIGQFLLASFQKKMANETGSNAGEEFRKAVQLSKEQNIDLILADRDLEITLKRAWGLTPLHHRFKLFGSFFFSGNDKPDDVNVEELKKSDAIDEMTGMFSKQLPAAKTVLIDERDSYLAYEVMNNLGEKTVAVVGAGHVKGILKKIQGSMSKEEHEAVKVIPPKSVVGKILTWGFPVLLIAIVGFGYLFGNREVALDMIYLWVLANGTLAALGCLISLAHPLTIVAGFVAAPITSLNPAIGAGFVTALVQTLLVKPRVRDLQQLQSGTMKFKHWWGNRLTKVFLVFILSSIGSSIGTFVAVPYLYKFFHG